MSDTVFKFGAGKACTPIEVDPFTPICSKPAVPGSEALTLEVPAPVFAPVVPPQECACFAFTSQPGTVNVAMRQRSNITEDNPLRKEVSIAVAATGDCCNGAYTVTPTVNIDVPECVTADHVIYSNTTDLGYGGSITCTLGIRDCVPYFEMSSDPISLTLPNIPNLCLKTTKFSIKASYTAADGTTAETTPQEISLKNGVDNQTQCQTYTVENSAGNSTITLDLTDFPTGGFGNGGSVFKASDGDLYIDGTIDIEKDIWFGGGMGNLATDNPNHVICRGPKMMGRENDYESIAGAGNHLVPFDGTKQFHLVKADANKTTAVAWHSSRKAKGTDAEDNPVYSVDTGDITPDKDPVTGEPIPEGSRVTYVGGNLSMILPSGFQWHERGIALNLSHFFWNDSGMLSVLEEEPYAALVSPAPRVFGSGGPTHGTGVNAISCAGKPAGGLKNVYDAVYTSGDNPAVVIEPGLSVKDGNGLRIFGLDGKTTATEAWSADKIGDLEVYGHSGDFLFNWDGKMVINDSKSPARTDTSASANIRERIIEAPTFSSVFDRTTDGILLMATADANATHDAEGEDFVWDFNSAKYLQVSTVGMYTKYDSAHSYWTGAEYYLGHIGGQTSSGTPITVETVVSDLVPAVRDTLATIDRIIRTLGTLCMAPLAFSKAGTLLSTSSGPVSNGMPMGYRTAQNISRHYAASAS